MVCSDQALVIGHASVWRSLLELPGQTNEWAGPGAAAAAAGAAAAAAAAAMSEDGRQGQLQQSDGKRCGSTLACTL